MKTGVGQGGICIRRIAAGLTAGVLLAAAAAAQAEMYFGAFAADGHPGEFRNIEGTGAAAGQRQDDSALAETLLIGGKAGYFYERIPWLGLEAELHHSTPHVKQNPNPIASPPLPTTGSSVSMWTGTINTVLRYPGHRAEPYVGLGLAVAHTRLHDARTDSTAVTPGLNAMLGLRVFLTTHVAIFGEFKYIAIPNMRFSDTGGPGRGASADFGMPAIAVGLTYHFRRVHAE